MAIGRTQALTPEQIFMGEAMPADPAISILQVAERLVSTARRLISTPTLVCKAPLSVQNPAGRPDTLVSVQGNPGARDKQQVVDPVDPVKIRKTGRSESEENPFKVKTGGGRTGSARLNWTAGPGKTTEGRDKRRKPGSGPQDRPGAL